MKAVHFGAGNIGRGFVGLLLHNAGYELVFADVNASLIEDLAATPSYTVREVGIGAKTWTVDNYRAVNSALQAQDLIDEIASAAIVTTAVGPNVLRFVAPAIAAGLAARAAGSAPLIVMACENAINATDALRELILDADPSVGSKAIFANTAVDRIVPGQPTDAGLDVTVEAFFEWAIESGPFGGAAPNIPEAHFVDDLAPYIERKLFTVNTGHAAAAYHGFVAGASSIADAMAIPAVATEVRAVLGETKALLVAKHDFDPDVQQAYLEKNLLRFANPYLEDTVERVGRQPIRKLGRHDRFIGPAAELAERGLPVEALLRTVAAVLDFDLPEDEQSLELQRLLRTLSPEQFVSEVTGIGSGHPLFVALVATVSARA